MGKEEHFSLNDRLMVKENLQAVLWYGNKKVFKIVSDEFLEHNKSGVFVASLGTVSSFLANLRHEGNSTGSSYVLWIADVNLGLGRKR